MPCATKPKLSAMHVRTQSSPSSVLFLGNLSRMCTSFSRTSATGTTPLSSAVFTVQPGLCMPAKSSKSGASRALSRWMRFCVRSICCTTCATQELSACTTCSKLMPKSTSLWNLYRVATSSATLSEKGASRKPRPAILCSSLSDVSSISTRRTLSTVTSSQKISSLLHTRATAPWTFCGSAILGLPRFLILCGEGWGGEGLPKSMNFFLVVQRAHEPLTYVCGTPTYTAPEIITKPPPGYGTQVDMWATGVIAFIILCGYPPFSSGRRRNVDVLYEQIRTHHLSFDEPEWKTISSEARDFVSSLLVKDPELRMTASEALDHAWLQSGFREDKRFHRSTFDATLLRTLRSSWMAHQRWRIALLAVRFSVALAIPMHARRNRSRSER
eukprot:m.259143 g.259143  ORF g.259143 m.259143 type:complete len:385 (-) comp11039_c2_seq8:5027-6181(-)